ncbi:MAG: hypothetical protein H8F28_22975 [Fibrella sp.]|nr:hypothetical protein [Armatimonadota bacterium]
MNTRHFAFITLTASLVGVLCLTNGCASPDDSTTSSNSVPANGTTAAVSNASTSGGAYPGMQGAKLTVPKKTGKDGH